MRRPCRRSAKIATRKGKADAQKAKLYGEPPGLEQARGPQASGGTTVQALHGG